MKKKIIASLVLFMSMVAFGAQKPCSEVFPNESNVATSLGIDGARCTVSKVVNSKGTGIWRIKVSRDNSSFVLVTEIPGMSMRAECEDVGAGRAYECKSILDKNGKLEKSEGELINAIDLNNLFVGVSAQDKIYLFGGLPPWEY